MQINRKRSVFYILMFLGISVQFAGAQVEPPVLNRVHIDPATQNVYISWEPSPTPGVTHYEVYKRDYSSQGIPRLSDEFLATVYGLEYSYHETDVQDRSIGYTVKAVAGPTTSDDSNRDSTIHLSVVYDSCTTNLHLEWNEYINWRGNMNRYEITVDGGQGRNNIITHHSLTDTTIILPADNLNYEVYITAYRDSPVFESSSNKLEVSATGSVVPEYMYANYGTVNEANQPEMLFTIDPNSELTEYVLFRSDTPDSFTDSVAFFNTSEKTISYTDNVDATQQAYYYQLATVSYCGNTVAYSENVAGTLHLTAGLDEYTANLNWNAYENWSIGVDRYEIQRRFGGGSFETIDESNAPGYNDASLESLAGEQLSNEVCYRVIAHENSGNPYTASAGTSTSITACVRLPAELTFDGVDAFIPGHAQVGTFGPNMEFVPADFNFKIYNRWGNLVFETSDAANPDWDGKLGNGTIAPEGVYRYQLQFSDEYSERVILHGKVTVVREQN